MNALGRGERFQTNGWGCESCALRGSGDRLSAEFAGFLNLQPLPKALVLGACRAKGSAGRRRLYGRSVM